MNNKILILGNGFIGKRLAGAFDCNISDKKIKSLRDAESQIFKYKPGIIINCIGYAGKHNVDDCEINKEKALFSNSFVPIILAEGCLRHGIKLVHVSTGCVHKFNYSKDLPISEKRLPDFFDLYYSRTKIYAERALELLCNDFNILIIRIRAPLDNRPHPKNLLTKLINYKSVIDSPNSVTYIPDFIQALKHLIKINAKGIYNIVNKGPLRYLDLMEIYKKYPPGYKYVTISFKKLNIVRTNLILSTAKLESTGFKVRRISEVLDECLQDYLKEE